MILSRNVFQKYLQNDSEIVGQNPFEICWHTIQDVSPPLKCYRILSMNTYSTLKRVTFFAQPEYPYEELFFSLKIYARDMLTAGYDRKV